MRQSDRATERQAEWWSRVRRFVGALSVVLLAGCASSQPASPGMAAPHAAAPTAETLPANVVVSNEAWTFENKEGRLIQTLSYRILTTATKSALVDRMPLFMELALIHYTTALGDLPRPQGEMETYLMANRPQWTRMTQRFMGEQADVYLQIQRGGFASGGRAILYDIGPRDTFAIAAHEGWHQYTQKAFKNPLPVSLEEGLATYMEGFRWNEDYSRPTFLPWANFERFEQLRTAEHKGKLYPLEKLMRSSPQELMAGDAENALVYYAQVWALIHFLEEGENGSHKTALHAMLADAASGRLIEKIQKTLGGRAASIYATRHAGVDLLAVYTGVSAKDLDGPYQAFIKQAVGNGSRGKIVTGKSPVTAD